MLSGEGFYLAATSLKVFCATGMWYRQYSLRTFLGFFLAICVLTGLVAISWHHKALRPVVIGSTGRAIAVIVVGLFTAVATGKLREALASAILGVVFADFVWLALLLILGESIDSGDIVYNPLLLITLLTCPAACVKSRVRAIGIGASISILLPAVVALWEVSRLPTGPGVGGTGLAAIVITTVAGVATITGFVGTVITRSVLELIRVREGKHEEDKRKIKGTF